MADGRMIKKLISTSKKLANLKTDSARLLYTWLIPHLDIEGRFSGEPDIVKGYIVPRLKTMDYDKIDAYLADMHENNLIDLYEVEGDKYLELIKFHKFQTLRKDRESASQIPDKCGLRDNSGGTPAKGKLKEGKSSQTKAKGSKGSLDFSLTKESIQKLFSDELKPVNQYEINTLNKLARYCNGKTEALPNLYIYLINTIADLKEHCKIKAKNHGDLMRMFVAKVKKDLK